MTTRFVWLLLPLALALGACATGSTTGPFTQVDRIERELRRGVSTRAEVERVLGPPRGRGATLLPGQTSVREVWSYEDAKVRNVQNTRAMDVGGGGVLAGGPPVLQADLQHQLLLVIFDREVLDGFVWYATDASVTSR